VTSGRDRGGVLDAVVIATVVTLSALPYVGRLAFYSDDWAFLSLLKFRGDGSLVDAVAAQMAENPNLRLRPTQSVYQAALHQAFRLEPLGYHLANLVVLVAVALLVYAVLRKLGAIRTVAAAVALVYALLPNYATARMWFASFGYLLSMAAWLVSLYGALAAVESGSAVRRWAWSVGSIVALAVALFGYEVVLPLAVLNIAVPEWRARRATAPPSAPAPTRFAMYAVTVAMIALAVVYKATTAVDAGIPIESLPFYVARLVTGGILIDFGTHGVALPHTAWWAASSAGPVGVGVAAVIGTVVYLFLRRLAAGDLDAERAISWSRMILAGLVVYTLGYAIFLFTPRIVFTGTGLGNRVATAATLGVAIVLVGIVAWISDRGRRGGWATAFPAIVGAICCLGAVVCIGVSTFWVRSADVQAATLLGLGPVMDRLSSGDVILLSGICPYEGPAPVFEAPWDLAGAVQVLSGDPTLRADVVTERTTVLPDGVQTRIYDVVTTYPYGDDLRLHDISSGRDVVLRDANVAAAEIARSPVATCDDGQPGRGTVGLPFDRLHAALERTGFRP
jgi:hypothetical protein